MNLNRLYAILGETTRQLRKGAEIAHESEIGNMTPVDMVFVTIGVDTAKAEKHRAELVEILGTYPDPERLAGGPSYIEVGGVIGDQGAAFCLFALGQTLGLWEIITPATFGLTGDEARQAAGSGFIVITGFRREPVDA